MSYIGLEKQLRSLQNDADVAVVGSRLLLRVTLGRSCGQGVIQCHCNYTTMILYS